MIQDGIDVFQPRRLDPLFGPFRHSRDPSYHWPAWNWTIFLWRYCVFAREIQPIQLLETLEIKQLEALGIANKHGMLLM